MKVRILVLLAAFASMTAMAMGALPITPDAVLRDVDTLGAKATVKKLTNGKYPQWALVLQNIETGDAQWLEVAKRLAAGTDAGNSEDILITLALALPKNPGGVLRLADTQVFLAIDDLCAAPFIEPEPAFLRRYLADAQRALKGLNDSAVSGQQAKCLGQIEKTIAEENLRSSSGNS